MPQGPPNILHPTTERMEIETGDDDYSHLIPEEELVHVLLAVH